MDKEEFIKKLSNYGKVVVYDNAKKVSRTSPVTGDGVVIFKITKIEKCIRCNKCVKETPVIRITKLESGVWTGKCSHCPKKYRRLTHEKVNSLNSKK